MGKGAISLMLTFLLIFTTAAFADNKTFNKYTGESQKDIEFAKRIYEAMYDSGVLAVEVNGSLMAVHVTDSLYREMYHDRISGNKIMRNWQKMVSQNWNGKGIGTVYLYVDNQKVAQCEATGFFATEVKVKWYDD